MPVSRPSFPISNFLHRLAAAPLIAALLCGVYLVLIAPPVARGQADAPTAPAADSAAGLRGVVSDPHQAVVTSALVKATNLQTKKAYSARTDTQGNYELKGLPAGEYKIEVAAQGFTVAHLASFTLEAGSSATQNFSLEVGKNKESVTVNAGLPDIDVKSKPPALIGLVEGVRADTIEFTASDIEAMHPATILDILQTVPGFEADFQGRQHVDFLSMRAGAIQVVLDGVYLAQVDRILATLPVQAIESITIVRDATALSIGPLMAFNQTSNGTSGVGTQGFIIIKTKRSSGSDAGFVSNGGNFSTAMGDAYVGSKSGNWDYRTEYNYDTSGGRGGYNMQSRAGTALFHGGYSGDSLSMDFMYFGSRGMRNLENPMTLIPSWTAKGGYNWSAVNTMVTQTFDVFYQNTNMFAMNSAKRWSENNRTVLQFAFDGMDVATNLTNGIPNPQNSTQADVDLKHTYRFKGHSITGGAQMLKYLAPFGSAPNIGPLYRIDDTLMSWYAQDEFKLLHNRLIFDGGVRADRIHHNWNATAKIPTDYWTGAFYTTSVGATYKVTKDASVFARFGIVQSPASSSYFVQQATSTTKAPVAAVSSSVLANQAQQRSELGANIKFSPYASLRTSLYRYETAHGTALASNCTFFNSATNTYSLSQSSFTDPVTGAEENCVSQAGDVVTYGGDASLSGKIVKAVKYSAGYGYVASSVHSNNLGMSHQFVNAQLDYRQKIWFANLGMIYVGPKWYTTTPASGQPGLSGYVPYFQLENYTNYRANVGADFKLFGRSTTLTVYGSNLANSRYITQYNAGAYLNPGRIYGGQLAVRLLPTENKKKQ